jgi:NAD(P)-dependent dehydrogenase (short-subunit alcohol dehydrogenase family)
MALRTKTVLITGVTKGIGRALAELFAKNGFNVAGCARNEKDVNEFKAKLWNNYDNQRFLFASVDVSDKLALQAFASDVLLEFQTIDVLINNAGVFIPGSILEEEDGIFEKQIHTNLSSAYHLTREIVPAMKAKKSGYVFNICSTASIMAYENGGSYCISKFALLGMTKVLRKELMEHNIKVSAVLPGATLTDSWAGTDLPAERFIKPQDIAKTIWDIYNLSGNTVVEEILIRPQLGDF